MARWHGGGDLAHGRRNRDGRSSLSGGMGLGGDLRRRLAVALRYNPPRDAAPTVVAEGGGPMAERILAVARDHGVPIREDPPLVQALAGLDVGESIPPELYMVVAELFVWLWRVDMDAGGRQQAGRRA